MISQHGPDHAHDHAHDHDHPHDHEHSLHGHASETGRRRRLVGASVAVAVTVAAVAAGAVASRSGSTSTSAVMNPAQVAAAPTAAVTAAATPVSTSVDVAAPAPSAEAAVRTYLDAEVRRDYATSFAQLGAADRRAAVDPTRWAAMHSQLPTYTSYKVDATTPQIATTVMMRPMLDEVVGVVPGSARITWSTVPEDGGYRVSLNASRFDPVFPSDADAPAAVLAWMKRQQSCDHMSEYVGSFIGPTSLSDRLCKLTGTFTAGAVKPLDAYANSTAVVTAFGPEAATWARVVTLTGPGKLDVVAAPLGDHWVVIGAGGSLKT